MQAKMTLIAVASHRSEYPNPITFLKGTQLIIGEKYEGPENWDNWYFCTIEGHSGGWVPAQIIQRAGNSPHGIASDDYTARELDIDKGDIVIASKALNGWFWCKKLSDGQNGWVPANALQATTTKDRS